MISKNFEILRIKKRKLNTTLIMIYHKTFFSFYSGIIPSLKNLFEKNNQMKNLYDFIKCLELSSLGNILMRRAH